jgi:hypothetical protein
VGADGVEKRLCGRVIGRPAAAGQSRHCAPRAPCSEDAVAPQRHRFTHAIFQDRGANGLSSASAGLPWAGSGAFTGASACSSALRRCSSSI